MNVIWKRPDGYQGANPSDFNVIELSTQSRIWLHSKDHENFPFRISGGWQEEGATKRLNKLVNYLGKPPEQFESFLQVEFNNSKFDNAENFLDDLNSWLASCQEGLKGDSWEVTIMTEILNELQDHLKLSVQRLKN